MTSPFSHDSYYKDKPDVDRDCDGNWDCPEALHTNQLVEHLEQLKRGEEVDVPIYDFTSNSRVKDSSVKRVFPAGSKGVLLVEGLMVLNDEKLRSRMDIRVYVDCDEDTRFMCSLLTRSCAVTPSAQAKACKRHSPTQGKGTNSRRCVQRMGKKCQT
eukprot:481260-Hanusia_phi.AAC.2